MKPHNWQIEYVDGGSVGGNFWICYECGASGGPVGWPPKGPDGKPVGGIRRPFFADGIHADERLSDDCDAARQRISEMRSDESIFESEEEAKASMRRALRERLLDEEVAEFLPEFLPERTYDNGLTYQNVVAFLLYRAESIRSILNKTAV